jgi:ABC-type amino acid transport substrate-binding protein
MQLNKRSLRLIVPLATMLVLAACGSPTPAPTVAPTAAPATEAPAATPTQAAAEATAVAPPQQVDDLARIKASGVLTVGISADNPPYSFYNSEFKVDGFEPALINDLAGRIGVKADLNDFAFDGLFAALQFGQVDAIIAALSITPERQELADFSNVYYIGADGVLGPANAATINGVADLAGKRVGAQTGSVYATYLKENLVDKGLSKPTDIFLFQDVNGGVRDLKDGKLDFFMLDRLPARNFAQAEGLKVVGENFNPQRFAVAVRRGSNLTAALNDALLKAQNDGTVTNLIQEYLKLSPNEIEPVPTPAPVPTLPPPPTSTPGPTPVPTPAPCVNSASFVEDLSFDDQNMTAPPVLQPGQAFTKGWRFRNSGNCDWAASFFLGFAFGNVPAAQMGGQPTPVGRVIAPGQTVDINVNLVAPNAPGTYQGFWQMNDANGTPFGERAWVGIQVPGQPTPTPPPAPTLVPGISFTANPTSINQGQCTTFQWNVQGVNGVWFFPQGQPWQNFGVPGVSSQVQCPQQTTTYFLRVQFNDGSVQQPQITISVAPASNTGIVINAFTAYLESNGCVLLQWQITGGPVTRVALLRGAQPVWDGAPISGNFSDCQPGAGLVTYTLQAFNGSGQVTQATQTIQVGGPGFPTPIPGPTAQP